MSKSGWPPERLLLSNGRRTVRSVAERFHIKWAAPHKYPAEMCTAVAFLPSRLLGSEENTANNSMLRGSYRLIRPRWNLVSIICTSFPGRRDPISLVLYPAAADGALQRILFTALTCGQHEISRTGCSASRDARGVPLKRRHPATTFADASVALARSRGSRAGSSDGPSSVSRRLEFSLNVIAH
jgi:hypothetical protein